MRRVFIALVLALGLVVSGCSHRNDDRPEPTSDLTPVDDPPWTPLKAGITTTRTPHPITGLPSLEAVAAASTGGASLLDAEQYALAVSHILADVRPGLAGTDVVDAVSSVEMTPQMRAYLIFDLDGQHQLGWDRQFNTALDMWIRSAPRGPENAPVRASIEIVANSEVRNHEVPGWDRMRFDVVREDGTWKLVSATGGGYGPSTSRNLTPKQQRQVLGTGPGWRRIPAA